MIKDGANGIHRWSSPNPACRSVIQFGKQIIIHSLRHCCIRRDSDAALITLPGEAEPRNGVTRLPTRPRTRLLRRVPTLTVAPLRENLRARLAAGADGGELQAFCDWLLQLGEGRLPGPEEGFVQLPPPLVMDADIDAVIDWVFGDLAERHGDRQWMASRAASSPTAVPNRRK